MPGWSRLCGQTENDSEYGAREEKDLAILLISSFKDFVGLGGMALEMDGTAILVLFSN